jgi:hypothetical protein
VTLRTALQEVTHLRQATILVCRRSDGSALRSDTPSSPRLRRTSRQRAWLRSAWRLSGAAVGGSSGSRTRRRRTRRRCGAEEEERAGGGTRRHRRVFQARSCAATSALCYPKAGSLRRPKCCAAGVRIRRCSLERDVGRAAKLLEVSRFSFDRYALSAAGCGRTRVNCPQRPPPSSRRGLDLAACLLLPARDNRGKSWVISGGSLWPRPRCCERCP